MKSKKVRTQNLNKKFFKLDFNYFPQSIYSKSNTKVIGNFKTRRSRPETVPIKRKLT